VHNATSEGVKIIRMAISAPRVGMMHESQCDGLSKTMGQDNLSYVPEGRRTWPNGSLYLYLLGKSLKEPPQKTEQPKVSTLLVVQCLRFSVKPYLFFMSDQSSNVNNIKYLSI